MESKVWSWGRGSCINMRVETPINVNTGGRAEVMQTWGGGLLGMALRADVKII